jgi:hypothetical protein
MAHQTVTRPPVKSPRAPIIKEGLDWEAAGWSGIIAGGVFLAIQALLGGGGGAAAREIASVALGPAAVSGPLSAIVVLAAIAVHLPLSLIYARLLAAFIDGMALSRAVPAGLAYGGVLYLLNYHAIASFFPWLAVTPGWHAVASHLAFGAVAAAVYARTARRRGEWR